MGESGNIVAYNKTFESLRLSELAAWLPEFAPRITNMQSRLWDLLPVMRAHVYHPKFAGSFSLKYVLPALVPDMTYVGMDVANGTDAGVAWDRLVRGSLDRVQREMTEKALLEYCEQDTMAMVRLVENHVSMFAAPELYSSIIFWNSCRKSMRVRFKRTIRTSF